MQSPVGIVSCGWCLVGPIKCPLDWGILTGKCRQSQKLFVEAEFKEYTKLNAEVDTRGRERISELVLCWQRGRK